MKKDIQLHYLKILDTLRRYSNHNRISVSKAKSTISLVHKLHSPYNISILNALAQKGLIVMKHPKSYIEILDIKNIPIKNKLLDWESAIRCSEPAVLQKINELIIVTKNSTINHYRILQNRGKRNLTREEQNEIKRLDQQIRIKANKLMHETIDLAENIFAKKIK